MNGLEVASLLENKKTKEIVMDILEVNPDLNLADVLKFAVLYGYKHDSGIPADLYQEFKSFRKIYKYEYKIEDCTPTYAYTR